MQNIIKASKGIGLAIFLLRKRDGIMQKELASHLNLSIYSYQQILRYENGEIDIKISTLEKICNVFNISLTEFFELANSIEKVCKTKKTIS